MVSKANEKETEAVGRLSFILGCQFPTPGPQPYLSPPQ